MNTGVNSTGPISDINGALDNFVARLQAAEKALIGSRHDLWRAVGSIVELARQIDCDLTARNRLRARVKDIDAVKSSRNFDSMKLDMEQLLIILAMGYDEDTKAKRSQYYAAIKAFKEDASRERTEAAFFDFALSRGGLRKAGQSSSDNSDNVASNSGSGQSASRNEANPAQGTGIAKKELIPNVIKLWKRSRDMPVVSPDLPRDAFVQGSAALALVIRVPDTNGGSQVGIVKMISDEKMVEREVAEAARSLSLSYREAVLIYRINTFALIFAKAPFFTGKIRSRTAIGFLKAVSRLKNRPEWCERYGLAEADLPSISYCNDGHEDTGSAEIANQDFHEWDPGRFIKGAKAGVLVPYSMKGTSLQISEAAKTYLSNFTSWKARWAKLETVTTVPFQSLFTDVSPGPSENVGQVTNDVIDAGQDGAPQNGEAGAASDDLQPVAASEAIAHGETETVVENSFEDSNQPEGQHAENGEVPAEHNGGQNAVQAFDMRQRQHEMVD